MKTEPEINCEPKKESAPVKADSHMEAAVDEAAAAETDEETVEEPEEAETDADEPEEPEEDSGEDESDK